MCLGVCIIPINFIDIWDSDGKMLVGLCYINLQEGSAEETGEELTAAPTPCFLVSLGGRGRQLVIKLSLKTGRRVSEDLGLLLIILL